MPDPLNIPCVPIGQSFALMSPVTGAVVLTNAFGQAIAKGIGMGLPPDELAARLADRPDERNEAKAAIQPTFPK